ncbi:bifunctional NADP-dependent methylenetetrahydromethanopterin dehydrogenase/methylenetetrahydrofolate dehydrogenase [bacterium]|nr:bifunctional NADP-dependent methylenetetrahydromethanopterin dehydrogenase/methylenetetrahydrofolate dehydrogenase [bacterium]
MPDQPPRILIQLDPDKHPSVFDRVVAVDAGVDQIFSYGSVKPEDVEALVHGAIFTRGFDQLKNTAIFIGGSDMEAGEVLLEAVRKAFFGPFRVSVMLDPNGSNTTAAAAVLRVIEGVGGSLDDHDAAVLAATGPVGRRVAMLLAQQGARVRVGSRQHAKSAAVAESLAEMTGNRFVPFETSTPEALAEGLHGTEVIVAAGAAGIMLLPKPVLETCDQLKVAIDLNAVDPVGIEGIKPQDKKTEKGQFLAWGALGVGSLKMKIHKAAIRKLFDAPDQIIDAREAFEIGKTLG